MTRQQAPAVALRLTIKLYEDEYPILIQDLLSTRKGQRRAARFATLASIGLVVERNVARMTHAAVSASARALPASARAHANLQSGEGAVEGLSDEDVANLFGTGMSE